MQPNQVLWNGQRTRSRPIAIHVYQTGGLFPVHKKSSDKNVPCSHAIYNRGIQRLEAMLYAVDTINKDDSILR